VAGLQLYLIKYSNLLESL